jgi:hypothetical protein
MSGSTLYTGVSPGYHTISVAGSADYEDTTELVQVTLGKTTETKIDLHSFIAPPPTVGSVNPSTGSIRVYVDRTGSTICIDRTDCFINVGGSPGPGTGTAVFNEVSTDEAHIITVTADGYKPVSATIAVAKDQIATADVSLRPLAGDTTPPTSGPTQPVTVPPTMPTARSGLGTVPVIGALALIGAIFIVRKRGK